MSKQSEAKAKQGYTEAVNNCGNCKHLQSDLVLTAWMSKKNADYLSKYETPPFNIEKHGIEKNIRCGIGGFKAKKTAFCKQWEMKVAA